MVIDIAESLITILKKLTICNFFENLIYFWVTLLFYFYFCIKHTILVYTHITLYWQQERGHIRSSDTSSLQII